MFDHFVGLALKGLKTLISSRRPKVIYLENAKTFEAGAKWLGEINRDEQVGNLIFPEHRGGKGNPKDELVL